MYRNKKDVDKHVESLMYKLSPKDFKTRAFSIARLYYEVGDYGCCQKYVEQYLSLRHTNAAAHKLLAQAFHKLGEKDKALEEFKTSLHIDPTQTATILDVCELLADDEVAMEPGQAKYWCEKAEATFPKHPITFRLKERVLGEANPDPEALENLLKSELLARPKDAMLHARLLKHYLQTNQIREAFDHSCNVEFDKSYFSNNLAWYETLTEILKYNPLNTNDWIYQLLLLTVKEKLCYLSLTEVPNSASKSLIECYDYLFSYDQSIESVFKAGSPSGFVEFYINLLQHHRGQLAFHAATFLLKKAKKDQLNWHDASKYSAPLMLKAWQTSPVDLKTNWLTHAPAKQQQAAHQWYLEGSYRCSQSGHYILSNIQSKNYLSLDQIFQLCSGTHWRDKLFEKIFTNRDDLGKLQTSHIASASFNTPIIRLPRKSEVQSYDENAQRLHPNSLHHFVWILLNYETMADFKCSIFDMLSTSMTSCGPETLNKMDIQAFLYCATLSAKNKKNNNGNYNSKDKPKVLPANITQLLCSLPQIKWWDCAYKLSQNELGSEFTDIRSTISRGIEVVRCVDNHGLDPELICILGRIFSNLAKSTTLSDEQRNTEARALLYYSAAVPLLEKIKCKISEKPTNRQLFDYPHKNFDTKELNNLLEESKVYVALNHLNEGEYDKVIELLSDVKSPQAFYQLSLSYKKMAIDEKKHSNAPDDNTKYLLMLSKAKQFAYKGLHKIKDSEQYNSTDLYTDIQALTEDIEVLFNKADVNISNALYETECKYSSDDNESFAYGEPLTPIRTKKIQHNDSSTPKQTLKHALNDKYRTAIDSQLLESTHVDLAHVERIEKQIKSLQKRDSTINDFMEQTKEWFVENKKLGNQIISTINSNIENTTEQFKLLRISVGQVKEQIDECRNECKDVADLKKQIADLKKEVNKLKKPTPEQAIDDTELFNLEEEYRNNENQSTFGTQIPFPHQQVIPPFAQRLVPPFSVPSNPYQLYGQNFYNLYNQYSQFQQAPAVPGAQQMFDPTRNQMNYPSVYTTPDQMYLDVAHLVSSNITGAPPVQVPSVPPPTVQIVNKSNTPISKPPTSTALPATTFSSSKNSYAMELKDMGKSLPANVVITSSDPLPSCTTAPTPVLSVTIPPKHIKNSPHNYQITMPPTSDVKIVKPPIYTFNLTGKQSPAGPLATTISNSIQQSLFTTTPVKNTGSIFNIQNTPETSCVDGVFPTPSPNTSLNKSRTYSEKSNTSVENYDPCPDFKPIVPLPAEVTVTTGEEDESVIFRARAKLFRFVNKQWNERGIGEMKLLKHKVTGKVRVLMRREQVHKICANHVILPEMEIKPMKNETKAYFWVANDFAEETFILEKFGIRFKTADIAKDFYNTFEKARQDSIVTELNETKTTKSVIVKPDTSKLDLVNTPIKVSDGNAVAVSKTVVGGFTFSSTPTFKPATEKTTTPSAQTTNNKVNVFSGLTFKNNNSCIQNILNVVPNALDSAKSQDASSDDKNKLNTSDIVEEYEPNVEFKPVVPLPALIDQKTGEEDENILYEHRAKLLRFDTASKEWKERGLGNIKLLEHKENNKKIRLLMRREQIMKICCNHAITKEMTFQKMPNMEKAVTWCAKDYSDGELVGETFCLRFKTVQACNDFIEAVKNAQSKIGDGTKAAKEEKNAAKVAASTSEPQKSASWGDKFKPKAGSWECNNCFIRNEASDDFCNACNSPKDPTIKKSEQPLVTACTPKFNFGMPNQNTQKKEITQVTTPKWGDKFKPKEGTWECQQCLIRNEANVENCSACNTSKDPSKDANKESKSLFTNTSGPKFTFGIPKDTSINKNSVINSPATTVMNQKFSFGISQANLNIPEKAVQSAITKSVDSSSSNKEPLNLTNVKNNEQSNILTVTPSKPTIVDASKTTPSFGENRSTHFGFSFTPKASSKAKSPVKTPKSVKGDDSDNEYASEDEGNHIHFSPVIPMPDKIQVVTGEENEEELYAHRAKLYRFTSVEWKERGIGIVKILKHKTTGKLRVVMRREQVLKICLNHTLTPEIVYNPKDEKTWIFAANDFSEGELVLSQFCLRFNNKEIAQQFKSAVDKALCLVSNDKANIGQDSNDVIFVSEIQATAEEKEKAKELLLPENFYTYKNKSPCRGCRGCVDKETKTDHQEKVSSTKNIIIAPKLTMAFTPAKTPIWAFQSPTNSIYGTPNNSADKTTDTTIFRTPLGAIVSNTIVSANSTINSSIGENDKENTIAESSVDNTILDTLKLSTADEKDTSEIAKPVFGEIKPVFGENKSIFSENKSVFGEGKSIFGNGKSIFGKNKSFFGDTQTFSSGINSTFGETKPAFGETKPTFGDIKHAFGETKPTFGETKPAFGETKPTFGDIKPAFGETKPTFGETKLTFGEVKPALGESKETFKESKSTFEESQSKETRSVFGAPKSVFGETKTVFGENKSVFGENTPVFGENKQMFGDNKTMFGQTGISSNKSIFGFNESKNSDSSNTSNIFSGASQKNIFDSKVTTAKLIFGSPGGQISFGNTTNNQNNTTSVFPQVKSTSGFEKVVEKTENKVIGETKTSMKRDDSKTVGATPFKVDNSIGFAELVSDSAGFGKMSNDFKWEGAGQPLFGGAQKKGDKSKNDSSTADESGPLGVDENYDPHYEPIVPLPDEIVVTTGEEDEEKLFSQRCKLYRYDEKTREWKERGVGELKILYHPGRNSYRLLQRREQVHKLVLNMLLFMDLELLPMKKSDRAWTWAGRNYAESAGEQETLAVRFKSSDLATAFYDKVQLCVRRLQVAAAEAIRKEKESKENQIEIATPLRMPKHLESSARADDAIAQQSGSKEFVKPSPVTQGLNPQARLDTLREAAKPEEYEEHGEDEQDECYQDYDNNEYSDAYYNEEDEESMYHEGKAVLVKNGVKRVSEMSHIEVTFDQEVGLPKIVITDKESGEVLADMRIDIDTEFTLSGDSCKWSGADYTTDDPEEMAVEIVFADSDTAIEFYDNCETTKAATYSGLEDED